jgi:hypothetical protein
VHSNKLSGAIPPQLSELTNLVLLSLHSNALSGTIPGDLSVLLKVTLLLWPNGALCREVGSTEVVDLCPATDPCLYPACISSCGTAPCITGNDDEQAIVDDRVCVSQWCDDEECCTPSGTPVALKAQLVVVGYFDCRTRPCGVGIAGTNVLVISYLNGAVGGTIPEELEHLATLTQIVLYGNKLAGTLPASLAALVSLQEIDVHDNQLTGAIPTQYGLLPALTRLALNDNLLSGQVPGSLTTSAVFLLFLNGNVGLCIGPGHSLVCGVACPFPACAASIP